MGNCSRKLEEDKERRMAIIILVYYITPSYLIFYFPGLSKGCYLVRISISGLDVSAALRHWRPREGIARADTGGA